VLPRRYISVGFTGVSDLMDIFLTFYIDYRTYSASAFAANSFVRSVAAATFPLFTVQLFTIVSRSGFFRLLLPILILLGPLIVGYKLGMHFDWLHRASALAISLLILQIRCQNTSPQQICAMYRKWFTVTMLHSDQFLLLGNRIFE
jgi:general stress protein CsbA